MRNYTTWMLLNLVIVIGMSGMTTESLYTRTRKENKQLKLSASGARVEEDIPILFGLYAAETEAIEDTIPTVDETSVIWPMNDMPATQLGVSDIYKANPLNDYKDLKTPAQITRQGDYYFIVDTYHDQILYASDLWKPVHEWRVLDRNMNKPHAIASDGQMYLVADTDNNRVLCYEYVNGRFQNTQCFDQMGTRPHYIQYDAVSAAFFIWSSVTGDMYIVKKLPTYNSMYIKEIRHIYELDGFYVRSFSIEGDEVLFPSGNNRYMIVADKETLQVKARYAVTAEISGMAAVKKIGGYYYMTVSTDEKLRHEAACMIRTPDLHSLAAGLYENVTPLFKDMKVPYYIECINGAYYVTSHEGRRNVYRFEVVEDCVVNVGSLY